MYFGFSDEEKMLKKSFRDLMEKHAPIDYVRKFIDEPKVSKSLQNLIGQQGILGMVTRNGDRYEGVLFAVAAFEEAGKALLPFPLLEGVLGTYALSRDETKEDLYAEVLEGRQLVTIAWHENGAPKLYRQGEGYAAFGSFHGVPFADDADRILAFFQAQGTGMTPSEETTLVILDRRHPAVSVHPLKAMDLTMPVYRVEVAGYPVTENDIILKPGDGLGLRREFEQLGALFASAEMLGLSDAVLYKTVEYTKVRKQFGQEIGKFQALKHMAADMYLMLESSRVAIIYAGWALESGTEPESVSIAKAYTSEAAMEITGMAIQMHGGIGYTWESDMHLYFKRARRSAAAFGDMFAHRERVIQTLLEKVGG
mgnify:CR=1 FL=1